MATSVKEWKHLLSESHSESLRFQWAAMALSMGSAEEKSFRLTDVDGHRWRVRLVLFTSPAGNPYSVVFRDLGASGAYLPDTTEHVLEFCDRTARTFGHSYETFRELAKMIREAVSAFEHACMSGSVA